MQTNSLYEFIRPTGGKIKIFMLFIVSFIALILMIMLFTYILPPISSILFIFLLILMVVFTTPFGDYCFPDSGGPCTHGIHGLILFGITLYIISCILVQKKVVKNNKNK